MWKMEEGIENKLQIFEDPMEIAEIRKLIVTAGQFRWRKITISMCCVSRKATKNSFQDDAFLWNANNDNKGSESKKDSSSTYHW